MNTHKHSWSLRAAMWLVLLLAISTTDAALGQQNNPLTKLPDGNWSFGIYPYHGPDAQDFPVAVGLVTSEIAAGAGATRVGIVNNSNKTVAAVRFKWLLFEGERRDRVLQQGSTPLLALRTTLAPDDKRILLYQVASLLKVYRPLLRNTVLNGDFEMEIFVGEVRFADGSKWRNGEGQAGQRNHAPKLTRAAFVQCPKQKCKSNTAGSAETVYYSCEASTFNEVCSVSSNARSCTNTACGFGGGGGEIGSETPLAIEQ